MNGIKYILMLSLVVVSSFSQAINVGALTSEIQENKEFIIKKLKNQEKIAKFVTTKVIEVENPKSLKPILGGAPHILVSPATLLIGPEKESNVKIYYKGPKDNKERYYQLVFVEQGMSKPSQLTDGANIEAKQKISIASILVARPRKIDFKYQLNGEGKIANTGNSFIQAVAVGQCVEYKQSEAMPCTKDAFILPGESIDFSKKMKIFEGYGLWRGLKYDFIPADKK